MEDPKAAKAPTAGTVAYFAPDSVNKERSLLPLPNLLAMKEDNSGTLNVSATQCYDPTSATAASLAKLDTLNGFGTYSAGSISAYFSGPLLESSIKGRVVLIDLGPFTGKWEFPDAVLTAIPVKTVLTKAKKYLSGCAADPTEVDTLVMIPYDEDTGLPVLLKGFHQYAVALKDGIRDASGANVLPYYVWSRLRSKTAIDPGLATDPSYLNAVKLRDMVQPMHWPVIAKFEEMGLKRDDILLGWTFQTQPTTAVLAGIKAAMATSGPLATSTTPFGSAGPGSTPLAAPPDTFIGATVAAIVGPPAVPVQSCATLGLPTGCPYLNTLIGGAYLSPNLQEAVTLANPTTLPYLASTSTSCGTVVTDNALKTPIACATTVPGRFTSHSAPTKVSTGVVKFFASTPQGVAGPYPVVIFQHPITPTYPTPLDGLAYAANDAGKANKKALLGLAIQLGKAGMAMIAIDSQGAGDRMAIVKNMLPYLANPTSGLPRNELYPIINSDALVTRDNIRQTVVDLLQLEKVLAACTPATCGGLNVDPAKIYFVGASMGAVIGTLFTSLSDYVTKAVLNAPAAGLIDALTSSPVLANQLAPSLCLGKIISSTNECCTSPATCTPAQLAVDPNFNNFKASGQWMADPGDPVNYASLLAAKITTQVVQVLVQKVTGDPVFPNTATDLLAGLLGLATDTTHFKAYDPGTCAYSVATPTNLSAHTMLLKTTCGTGTTDMQADLIAFLLGK